MDNSRISGGYLKKLLRGENFAKSYAEEQKRAKKADDEAFAAYCAKAEADEIADQEAAAKEGLIGRARRQKKHQMCAHGAVAREKGQHGQHAEEGFEGSHETHGLPDIISGRRPGVALFHKKSANVRVRGQERSKLLREFKNGFVISYLWEFRDQMRDCFTAMDKDGSGELNKTEFEDGLHETMGIMLSNKELDTVFDIVDTDKSGHIEWHEIHACIRSAPRVTFVGLEQFYDDMMHLGYEMSEHTAEALFHRVCLQTADEYDSGEDAHTEKVELRRIRYIDLHKELKPQRMKNLRRMLRNAFQEETTVEMIKAEQATGGLWKIERTTTKTFRELRDMPIALQQKTFRQFATACQKDEIISGAASRKMTKPTMAMLEVFEEMLKDTMLVVKEHALHVRIYGPDKAPPTATPMTPTQRAGMMCAVSYVRALMNEKLTRVRDLFREMDADNGGDVNEAEFRYGLKKVGVSGVTSQDISLLFKALDSDRGGTVSYQELRDGLRERNQAESVQFPAFRSAMYVLGLEYLFEDQPGGGLDSGSAKERALKLFHHVSRPCKRNKVDRNDPHEYRKLDFRSMVRSIAHVRLMKYQREREKRLSEGLEAEDEAFMQLHGDLAPMDLPAKTKNRIKKNSAAPRPPPRPPAPRRRELDSNRTASPNSIASSKSRRVSSPDSSDTKQPSNESEKETALDKFFNKTIKMFVEEVEMKLIEMGKLFPEHIKVGFLVSIVIINHQRSLFH